MLKGLLKLSWIEMKIFLREPMGVVGSLVLPVLLFVFVGRALQFSPRGPEPPVSRLPFNIAILTALLISLGAVQSLVAIMAIYREGGILKRLRATPLSPVTILGAHVLVKLVFTLVATVGVCFAAELLFAKPDMGGVLLGFVPSSGVFKDSAQLYVAIGIIGATVMPHNLYLHSSIVQTRKIDRSDRGLAEAVRYGTIDSTFALMCALFINAAILVVAAATFHERGHAEVAEIQEAYRLLSPVLGVGIASTLFAIALLAAGQNSTLTGTLSGQIVMEGFINFRMRPWARRLVTRLLAIIPAVVVIGVYGESRTTDLLVASQVVLSMQLGFAVWPLLRFTGSRAKMGRFVNPTWIKVLGWTTAAIIIGLNVKLLFDTFIPASWRIAIYGA